MKRFWVYFRGTTNGEHIEAASMKRAKEMFASHNGLVSLAYIAARHA